MESRVRLLPLTHKKTTHADKGKQAAQPVHQVIAPLRHCSRCKPENRHTKEQTAFKLQDDYYL